MTSLLNFSRTLFAVTMATFGILHLLHILHLSPAPAPPWIETNPALTALFGILLLIAAIGLLAGPYARYSAATLACVPIVIAIFFLVPTILATPNSPNQYIRIFELISFSAAALMLMNASAPRPPWHISSMIPRTMLALALADFGIQHFMYAQFVATLVPAWIPAHLFWAYFVGVAFIAAALAISSNIQIRLAGILLGIMFAIFVVTTHTPRIAASPRNPNEWTSGLVALCMIAVSWITASTAPYCAKP